MSLGDTLLDLRKRTGMSQESVAEKLGVSRQTISKWESNQSAPDLLNAKKLSRLYNVSYDYLIGSSSFNGDPTNVEMIVDEVDWTKAWSTKYPILGTYQGMNGITFYTKEIDTLYNKFKNDFKMSHTDTVLILKDILYQKFKSENKKK